LGKQAGFEETILKRTVLAQGAPSRFRMFHSVGFQGDIQHALTVICLVLKQLDF
jgi:hypothetical protein